MGQMVRLISWTGEGFRVPAESDAMVGIERISSVRVTGMPAAGATPGLTGGQLLRAAVAAGHSRR